MVDESNGFVRVQKQSGEWVLLSCDAGFILSQVCTIKTAATLWTKNPKTIIRSIDTGKIIASKDSGTWLISVPSLVKLWGTPSTAISEFRTGIKDE